MLKHTAILLAAISISACDANTETSQETTPTESRPLESTSVEKTEQRKANAAALKKATEAAIIIESYEPSANSMAPQYNNSGNTE